MEVFVTVDDPDPGPESCFIMQLTVIGYKLYVNLLNAVIPALFVAYISQLLFLSPKVSESPVREF